MITFLYIFCPDEDIQSLLDANDSMANYGVGFTYSTIAPYKFENDEYQIAIFDNNIVENIKKILAEFGLIIVRESFE